ncbi:hypothetical protein SERLA73DRAFT_170917 [Serpula lacrymans var. lacrymans S7.3]|uniref:Actin interacting protein 3 C-terminal domain-containing protein n=1 Tax=Serpula lacrymans var. lacrymans (strain S7.3) TaxID=936435 RepID=F8Q8X7_SERL3|nr:hypothetical protein SERLA73DRAFT_170917 [Serpula lacrymans var. lacrymans S7.3]
MEIQPAVESAVTRLLVAIKQLLESLTLWSTLKMSEDQVSDVYVRLGNDFNAAVAAFGAFNIDMSDLMAVPEDLREVLEVCLSEEATAENLAIYLPKVREIITSLLQGLRGKQSMYRRIVSDHRHRSEQSTHSRTDSRSSRSEKSSRRDGETKHRSQLSRSTVDEERIADKDSISRRSAQPSGKKKEGTPQVVPSSLSEEKPTDVPGRAVVESGTPVITTRASLPSSPRPTERTSTPKSNTYHPSLGSIESSSSSSETLVTSAKATPKPVEKDLPPTSPTQAAVPVPSSVKRYSLVDKPMSPPTVVIEEPEMIQEDSPVIERVDSGSPPETPPLDSLQAPGMASSLAALKKSDTLARRASKRFSTYNISKMTGSSTTRERSTKNSNRRSLAASSALTPGDLAVLTEVDESPSENIRQSILKSNRSQSRTPSPAIEREPTPPVPSLPTFKAPTFVPEPAATPPPPELNDLPRNKSAERTVTFGGSLERIVESPSRSFDVFLQLGREVKKVSIEPGITFSSVRMLFVDKFTYNPGLENFPAIYIRDPSSGVQYELEDMDEVKEKCLLSLNIEPLDQIKQHIDSQISGLSQDIKELKSTISSNRRSSAIQPIVAHDFAESTPIADRPSDKHFQHVARRLSRIVGDAHFDSNPFIPPQMTGQSLQLQPQMTGASMLSEYSTRVVTDLKTQFDEVQNLRRDLGIMRQLYTDFMKQTKESLGTLRNQTQSVKQLATTNVGGARAYIDSGKTKLDTRSQNVLTKVEELQDMIEGLKDDVLKRHVNPKPQLLKSVQEDTATTAAELASLKEHIKTIKPMWKKTWEEELQNIVEEQGFLSHQEEFLSDLLDDHKAVVDILTHIEKVISIRGTTPGRMNRGRGFKPLPVDEGHGGLTTVMMEIRGASVDPERRMKAIAANQKNREKELASRSDEFQDELVGFVSGKKLKLTGGAEEVERVRQKRNEVTLKAMFNGPPPSADAKPLTPSSTGGF